MRQYIYPSNSYPHSPIPKFPNFAIPTQPKESPCPSSPPSVARSLPWWRRRRGIGAGIRGGRSSGSLMSSSGTDA